MLKIISEPLISKLTKSVYVWKSINKIGHGPMTCEQCMELRHVLVEHDSWSKSFAPSTRPLLTDSWLDPRSVLGKCGLGFWELVLGLWPMASHSRAYTGPWNVCSSVFHCFWAVSRALFKDPWLVNGDVPWCPNIKSSIFKYMELHPWL